MASPDPPVRAARRARGSRAGLTRARIVEAARGLEVGQVTVKAIADRLGVDRAAVHHHIRDLEGLRELVALDAFTLCLASVVVPPDAPWRDACRTLVRSIYAAVLRTGGLGVYVQLGPADVAVLEPVEQTLRTMTAAGFDDETSARSLATLATLAAATAREQLMARRVAGHPQVPELRRALSGSAVDDLQHLRRLAQADLVTFDEEQLDFGIDLVLDGMSARLTGRQVNDRPGG